jgi:hypothetical protein
VLNFIPQPRCKSRMLESGLSGSVRGDAQQWASLPRSRVKSCHPNMIINEDL